MYIYPLFLRFFSHIDHYRLLSRFSYALYQVLTSYLSFICVCVQSLSHVWLFVTPWTVACQAPLFVEFSRQDSWVELSLPTPGDFPDPGIELTSLEPPALAGEFITTGPPGNIFIVVCTCQSQSSNLFLLFLPPW